MSSAPHRVKRPVHAVKKPVSASSPAYRLPRKRLVGSAAVLLLAVCALAWKFAPLHSASASPAQPAAFAAGTPVSFAEMDSLPPTLHPKQEIQTVGGGSGWKRADQLHEGDKVWYNGKWMVVQSVKKETVTETKEVEVPATLPAPKPRKETTLALDLSPGGDTFEETLIVPASETAVLLNGTSTTADKLKVGDHAFMSGNHIALVEKVETKWYTPPPHSVPDEHGNVVSRVIGTVKRMTGRILYLHTNKETIGTTPEHPFSIEGKGWVQAGRLQPGDRIKTEDGKAVTVESLEVKAERKMVYNLKVEGTENYFVGKNKLLVHNGGDCLPDLAKLAPKELNQLIGQEQRNILKEFLGQGLEGARARTGNFHIPNGLSRDTLEIYREIARRASDSTGVQAERLKLIERALEHLK